MKKLFTIMCASTFVFGAFAIAQDQDDMTKNKDPMPQMMGRMFQDGMMHGKLMCMGAMMSIMGGKMMVSSQDGGVIVLVGNKLQKYDQNLALKKEVEIKIDMEDFHKLLQEVMDTCHMSEKMMQNEMKDMKKDSSKTG